MKLTEVCRELRVCLPLFKPTPYLPCCRPSLTEQPRSLRGCPSWPSTGQRNSPPLHGPLPAQHQAGEWWWPLLQLQLQPPLPPASSSRGTSRQCLRPRQQGLPALRPRGLRQPAGGRLPRLQSSLWRGTLWQGAPSLQGCRGKLRYTLILQCLCFMREEQACTQAVGWGIPTGLHRLGIGQDRLQHLQCLSSALGGRVVHRCWVSDVTLQGTSCMPCSV